MMKQAWIKSFVLSISAIGGVADAATLRVPQHYPTIQSAVDAAARNDTVLVGPGTYFEHVVVGKSLNLVSSQGAARTIIDASHFGTALKLYSPGPATEHVKVSGFTLTHGEYIFPPTVDHPDTTGAGLYARYVILEADHNIIEDNLSCGVGLDVYGPKSTITDNVSRRNSGTWVCVFEGGGMGIGGPSEGWTEALIERNEVYENFGPGMYVGWFKKLVVRNNHIHHNIGPRGGIGLSVESPFGEVTDNLIDDNGSAFGSGMRLTTPSGDAIPDAELLVTRNVLLHNDPIPQNNGELYDGTVVAIFDWQGYYQQDGTALKFFGNTVISAAVGGLVYCEPDTHPKIFGNVLVNTAGPQYTESCQR